MTGGGCNTNVPTVPLLPVCAVGLLLPRPCEHLKTRFAWQCRPQGEVRARVHGVRILQQRQAEVRQQLQLQERHHDPEGGDCEPGGARRSPPNYPGGGHHCVSVEFTFLYAIYVITSIRW